MTDIRPEDVGETGSIEVRVYRDGKVVERQLCESTEQAAAVVEAREQIDGIECEVRDLSGADGLGDISEPELGEAMLDDYPTEL